MEMRSSLKRVLLNLSCKLKLNKDLFMKQSTYCFQEDMIDPDHATTSLSTKINSVKYQSFSIWYYIILEHKNLKSFRNLVLRPFEFH